VVFLHALKPGAADRSWGIAVAKLAGLPREVTGRAAAVLAALEERARGLTPLAEELPLFAAPAPKPAPPAPEALRLLAEADPDALSPREAHALLVRLRSMLGHATAGE
jgi:DNA mismatch repair protein MutS